ncbi:hypothetical protein HJ590_15760 [Naumannella sp. ID2617S]|nr:hypothetical protein [Naumannella sp. ID2617S]
MRTDSIWFHLISLGFTVVGIAMLVIGREPMGLVVALFFGGGWVATQAIRRDRALGRWPRLVAGIATLGVAASSLLMVLQGETITTIIGVSPRCSSARALSSFWSVPCAETGPSHPRSRPTRC